MRISKYLIFLNENFSFEITRTETSKLLRKRLGRETQSKISNTPRFVTEQKQITGSNSRTHVFMSSVGVVQLNSSIKSTLRSN